MKVNRALNNPKPVDFSALPEQDNLPNPNPEKQSYSPYQVPLQIDNRSTRIQQQVSSFRMRLKKRMEIIEVAQFWKNPAIPFMIMSSVFNILILLFGGLIFFNELPARLQLFYDPTLETWTQAGKIDKSVAVFIIPAFLTLVVIVQYKLVTLIFKNDKRLAITISWLMTFMNIMILIAISQIFQLN